MSHNLHFQIIATVMKPFRIIKMHFVSVFITWHFLFMTHRKTKLSEIKHKLDFHQNNEIDPSIFFSACDFQFLVQDGYSNSSHVVFITVNINDEGRKRVYPLPLRALLEITHDDFSYSSLERTQLHGPMWLQGVLGNKMAILGRTGPVENLGFYDERQREQRTLGKNQRLLPQKQTKLRYVLKVKLAGFDD